MMLSRVRLKWRFFKATIRSKNSRIDFGEPRGGKKHLREEANKVECLFDLRCKSEYAFA